jgi:hypothetical protein
MDLKDDEIIVCLTPSKITVLNIGYERECYKSLTKILWNCYLLLSVWLKNSHKMTLKFWFTRRLRHHFFVIHRQNIKFAPSFLKIGVFSVV